MNSEPDAIPLKCGPTLERIQAVLDRIHPASILAADAHSAVCPACRARVLVTQRVLNSFAEAREVWVPASLTYAILTGVRADRRMRSRRRAFALVGGFAAAAVVFAVWFNQPKPVEVAKEVPIQPLLKLQPPAPMRVTEELAKAGDALRESSRTITEPAASAPRVFAALTDSLLKAPAAPVGIDLGPAGRSLSEIPDAARSGLEPVTGTAQKAFNRLLRDVASMQPKSKS